MSRFPCASSGHTGSEPVCQCLTSEAFRRNRARVLGLPYAPIEPPEQEAPEPAPESLPPIKPHKDSDQGQGHGHGNGGKGKGNGGRGKGGKGGRGKGREAEAKARVAGARAERTAQEPPFEYRKVTRGIRPVSTEVLPRGCRNAPPKNTDITRYGISAGGHR